MFTSFVHMIGFVESEYRTNDVCYRHKKSYGPIGRGSQEIDQRVRLCRAGPNGVLAVFKRNEALLVNPVDNIKRRSGKPAVLCDWHQEIPQASFVVINRGMWRTSDWLLLHELNGTFTHLAQAYARSDIAERVLFRSTWGSLADCRNLRDPLTRPQSDLALKEQVLKQRDKKYEWKWGKISHQNDLAHHTASAFGIPFWDVYPATVMRPGGHRAHDCSHFCLPGPPDELTREMIAYMLTF